MSLTAKTEPAVCILSAREWGRNRARRHAVCIVDRRILRELELDRPATLPMDAVGMLEHVRLGDALNEGSAYPFGRCGASRDRLSSIEIAQRAAAERGLPLRHGVLRTGTARRLRTVRPIPWECPSWLRAVGRWTLRTVLGVAGWATYPFWWDDVVCRPVISLLLCY